MINLFKQRFSYFVMAFAVVLSPAAAKAQSLVRDSEVEKLVRDYSDPLFVAAGLNPDDIKIYLVDDKEINAFVTDGQKMFVNAGTILEATSPNQLKGVIAHETGHIAGGHLARSSQAEKEAMVPAYVTIALGIVAIAAGAPDAGAALLASSQQFAILSFYSYTRTQESSADQAALQYLEKTHQSPQGLIDFFEKFRYQEVMSEARRTEFFRSHPLSTDRIDALERRAASSPYLKAVDSDSDKERLALAQAKLYGFLYTGQQVYVKYPFSDNSIPAQYARAIAYYRAPDLDLATDAVQKLINAEPNNPYFQELMGQIYFENGKSDKALPYYQKSVSLLPNDSLLRIGLARTYINLGTNEDLEKAETELRNAVRLEDDNAFAWNQIAIVADKQGKDGLARLATAEEAFALGDYERANRFAQAAMRKFDRHTPSWQRASDIRSVTEEAAAKAAKANKQ